MAHAIVLIISLTFSIGCKDTKNATKFQKNFVALSSLNVAWAKSPQMPMKTKVTKMTKFQINHRLSRFEGSGAI
jgi:hypothetical protein